MAWAIGGYTAAITAVHALPSLPDAAAGLATAAVVALAATVRSMRWIVGVGLGVVVASCSARHALEHRVAECIDGRTIEMRGRIDGLPRQRLQQVQFDLAIDAIVAWPACGSRPPRRVRLTWYDAPPVAPGEIWQLRAKLRGVRGYQNPGGFDYEAFALADEIDGVGAVEFGRRLGNASGLGWDALRMQLRERWAAAGLRQPGVLLAMLTGDAGLLSEREWSLFRATGTVHLMVISGLHMTIVGAIGIAFGRLLARLSRRSLARHGTALPSAVCSTAIITSYACLAGWGVAVLRAWVAAMAVAMLVCATRRASLPALFVRVAAILLSIDPLAPLQAGFWLSMSAVAVLLAFFAPRLASASMLHALVTTQLVMAVAMTPVLTGTIGNVAWIGALANVVAVPVLSVVVVPIDLLAALSMTTVGIGEGMLRIADVLTDWTIRYLEALASIGWVGWRTDASPFIWLVSAACCGAWLLPLPLRHRALLLPGAFLSLLPAAATLPPGHFQVDVFDVGQGLAVSVATARHALLYDAGPRYRTGFDLGRVVVVPALSSADTDRLDAVIVSHSDIDHVGGLAAVAEHLDRRALLAGAAIDGFADQRSCARDQGWQWDGVRFRVFRAAAARSDNDRSCVLMIDNGSYTALLPGDVTRRVEAELAAWLGGRPVDLLVAAHHGSASSTGALLVRKARPRIVVYSAGYLNRFGHPHREVVCRLRASGAHAYATAYSGAVVWLSNRPDSAIEWRRRAPPYWRVSARSEEEWQPCGEHLADGGSETRSRESPDHPP